MYSVEDLLISHGYKLPKTGSSSSSSSVAAASAAAATAPYDKRYADCHRDTAENRPSRGALNGYEADRGACVYGSRQALVLAKGYPADSEHQRRKEAGSGNLGDAQPLGDSLATDSGFYDAPSLSYSEQLLSHDERDVSYWRRRGQDFSVLLDYADGRELRASAGSWRPQALIAAGEHRERQQQLWEDLSWLRDPDSAPGQLRVTGERKCQSLGTEEWRPAVGLGRQLSDGEGERWAQEQQHRLRMTEVAALPRTKGKSQSLPRVLSPDGTERTDMVLSRQGQVDRQRVNSTVFSGPYSRYYYSAAIGRERWGRGWPSGHVALLPKPRFNRPVKPPSYEIHQQTRGSSETLAADQGLKQKDRPIYYYPRGGELQRQDYFAQHSAIFGIEPPGYIPPPSYRRAPLPRGGPINRNELTNYRWRGEVLQVPVSSEAARWFSRQTGGSWLEHYGDRVSAPYRRHAHPGYSEEHLGHVRYLPFDDPRVRHNSGGPGGNSLTDSDKIRNINKEIPCAKVLGQSTNDSAFSPPQGPSVNTDGRKASINDNDSSNRWCNRGINKGTDSVACEPSSGNYPAAFQVRQPPPPPPPQSKPADQGVAETVKKSEPEPEKERPKSIRKKLNETIFCLVSVPALPAPGGTTRDQNNNDEKPPDQVDSPSENKTGHLTNQSLQSTSSAEAELQTLTGSIASSLTSSRASSKVVRRVPCRPPKINHYKELKLSGSWPANQYRDQETQTSPEAQKPAPPGPENKEAQEPVPQGSDVALDSGVGSTAFSYPIKGVKSLKPSSNSAFSRTSTFSSQLNKSTAQTPAPPSGNVEEAKPALAAAVAPAAAASGGSGGQEAFGQFLLKPVSRRPWDAIEELETINKELQNQQSSKRPSVDQCIEDLNEAYKDILELGTASNKVPGDSNVQIPERIKIRMSGEPLNKPSSLRRSMDSWSVDPEYREVKSAFSRPAAKSVTFSKQLREELPVPPRETGFREYRVIPNLSHKRNSDGRTVKLDLPDEPIEMPLCDFSPTTHATAAEVPWADRQPMQDASTLTSPPDYEDICQTLRQSRDTAEGKTCRSKPGAGDSDPPPDDRVDSEEECPICRRESESQMRQLPMPPLHEEDCLELTNQNSTSDDTGAAQGLLAGGAEALEPTDSSSNQSEPNVRPEGEDRPSLSDQNAGGAEKSGAVPTEDRNDSREVKPEEGMSESKSIEERAARILGIDVPAESLVTEEKSTGKSATGESQSTVNETTRHVPESSEDEPTSHEKDELEALDSQSADGQEQDKKQQNILEPRIVLRAQLGRDPLEIPEFPPERLPLSVPLNPDHRLSLSVEGERRSRGPSQRIEALQDRLAASPSRVAVERLARMKEVDSVSRMRRLSIRSTDSGEGEASGGQEEESLPSLHRMDDGEVSQTATVSMETVLPDQDKARSASESPPLCPRDVRLEPNEGSVESPPPSSPSEVLAPTL